MELTISDQDYIGKSLKPHIHNCLEGSFDPHSTFQNKQHIKNIVNWKPRFIVLSKNKPGFQIIELLN